MILGQAAKPDLEELYDQTRGRKIPIAIYKAKESRPKKLAVFMHGYGQNRPDSCLAYGYLTNWLAEQGWQVFSIQNELDSDPPLPTSGEIKVVRMPFWQQGSDNISCLLRNIDPSFAKASRRLLIGHSQGGDTAMLHCTKHPADFTDVITLDHRRMPMPRISSPRISSLRSSDQLPDLGVIPSRSIAADLGIRIVRLKAVTHNDMDETGSPEVHEQILGELGRLLEH